MCDRGIFPCGFLGTAYVKKYTQQRKLSHVKTRSCGTCQHNKQKFVNIFYKVEMKHVFSALR